MDVVADAPWTRCPSTHCQRRHECASPSECSAKSMPDSGSPFLEPGWTRGIKLAELLPVLQKIASGEMRQWYWGNGHWQCKYLTISIDTRDGGFCAMSDRDGKKMTLEQIEFQREWKP